MSEQTGLEPGCPWPLGSNCTRNGVNFAVFSQDATRVAVCLFDADGKRETARYDLTERTDGVWHGHLSGATEGLVYGYRAWGPVNPDAGLRFNPAKLLLDPYARRFSGAFRWTESHLDDPDHADEDNARDVFKSVVTRTDAERDDNSADRFDWQGVQSPATPFAQAVLYEVHVKGFTRLHPDVPAELRGTYEGFCSPAAIAHLKRLGITAVSLLPVQQAVSEQPLVQRGLSNYWGYNTIGFFAPDSRFARNDPVREFKTMVRELHRAGIEVILDVVYNHTAEGDHRGPTLSMRGLDNRVYYHLQESLPSQYKNFTGTGNSLNLSHPKVLQLVMDSLRYWVAEMHVDGFRFDLAATLGRHDRASGFDREAAFFHALHQDPVLARTRLIAEPWDIGSGGYQLGQFPTGWSEWNDRYRDSMRGFWVSKGGYRGDMATRLAGSPDLFQESGRPPQASVNYLTAHDGFTLQDVVSYSYKHNEANGEDNQDGTTHNYSWNCGLEGPTDLLMVNALRARLKRALLASLLLSQGTPMLLGGDEMGRTQGGNNNAYNQDNETSWFDWSEPDSDLIEFTAWLIDLRRRLPQLRRPRWLRLDSPTATGQADGATWLNRSGDVMTQTQWSDSSRYVFGLLIGAGVAEGTDVMLLFNAEAADATFRLPEGNWRMIVDSGQRNGRPVVESASGTLLLKARSVTLLQRAPLLPESAAS